MKENKKIHPIDLVVNSNKTTNKIAMFITDYQIDRNNVYHYANAPSSFD